MTVYCSNCGFEWSEATYFPIICPECEGIEDTTEGGDV